MPDKIINSFDVWITAQGLKSKGRLRSVDNISLEGIARLRELILELAIRGKLVPQESTDEPVRVLLKRISGEKDQLEREGKIKKQKTLPSIAKNDISFNLPQSWEWVRLGTISEANTGYAFKSDEYTESGTFVLRVTNINPDGSINLLDTKFISNEAAERTYEKFSLSHDDLLLVMVGGSLGKLGIVSKECLPAVLNQNMWKLSRFGKIPLKYFITGVTFINNNQLKITSSTHGHLAQGEYMNKLFPLPPLAEQHRIVAKVDELMTLCDDLEKQETNHLKSHQLLVEILLNTLTRANDAAEFQTAWTRLAEYFDDIFTTEDSIDQLKQTILQLAVRGKLVPQNPNDGPASELLRRISEEKEHLIKKGEIGREKSLPQIAKAEMPFKLPDGWAWERLSNLCEIITKGSSPKWQGISYTDNESDVLFVTSENVGSYRLLLSERKFVEKKFNEIEPRSILRNGDFLMNIVGGSIGRTAVYNLKDIANINQAVCLIRVVTGFMNDTYLLHFFNSEVCISYMFDKQVDSARANLSMGNISKFVIPVPPKEEQYRIVAKVDELFALCDQLKGRIVESQKVVNQMANSVGTMI